MRKRTEAEWRDLAEEYRSSGMPQEEWCKQNGVNLYTFRDRLSKLKKMTALAKADPIEGSESIQIQEAEPIRWLPITHCNPMESAGPAKLEVVFDGFTILVPQGFNKETFSEICKVLMSLC